MNVALTDRQTEVLRAIKVAIAAKGHAPTCRELMEVLGIGSTNGVHDHLKALKRKGAITWTRNQARTIRVLEPIGSVENEAARFQGDPV